RENRPGVRPAGAVRVRADPGAPGWNGGVLRYRIPRPSPRSSPGVESAYLATDRISSIVVGNRGANYDDSAHYGGRRSLLVLARESRRVSEPIAKLHDSTLSKLRARGTSRGVE